MDSFITNLNKTCLNRGRWSKDDLEILDGQLYINYTGCKDHTNFCYDCVFHDPKLKLVMISNCVYALSDFCEPCQNTIKEFCSNL